MINFIKNEDGVCLAENFSDYERIKSARLLSENSTELTKRLNLLETDIADIKNLLIKMSKNG
jgi:hypothetical protein